MEILMDDFKLWSELNPEAKKELKPDLGLRDWNSLKKEEKELIWNYLDYYFFNIVCVKSYINDLSSIIWRDYEKNNFKRIEKVIFDLNKMCKYKNYTKNYLKNDDCYEACKDFYNIFINESENVVIELLSLYCKALIEERQKKKLSKRHNETDEEYDKRLYKWRFEDFNNFSKDLNEVFNDFGVNLYLTRKGFILRQDNKIMTEIYEPVLKFLSHSKWEPVNKILEDAFKEYSSKQYSNCITKAVTSIQAFLQITVNGKIGKLNISKLITIGQNSNLIPNDTFTKKIFDNMESIFSIYRQDKGIAHPPKEEATEKDARLILNLVMIFMQHCIQD